MPCPAPWCLVSMQILWSWMTGCVHLLGAGSGIQQGQCVCPTGLVPGTADGAVPGGSLAGPQFPGLLALPVGCFSCIPITSVSNQLSFR